MAIIYRSGPEIAEIRLRKIVENLGRQHAHVGDLLKAGGVTQEAVAQLGELRQSLTDAVAVLDKLFPPSSITGNSTLALTAPWEEPQNFWQALWTLFVKTFHLTRETSHYAMAQLLGMELEEDLGTALRLGRTNAYSNHPAKSFAFLIADPLFNLGLAALSYFALPGFLAAAGYLWGFSPIYDPTVWQPLGTWLGGYFFLHATLGAAHDWWNIGRVLLGKVQHPDWITGRASTTSGQDRESDFTLFLKDLFAGSTPRQTGKMDEIGHLELFLKILQEVGRLGKLDPELTGLAQTLPLPDSLDMDNLQQVAAHLLTWPESARHQAWERIAGVMGFGIRMPATYPFSQYIGPTRPTLVWTGTFVPADASEVVELYFAPEQLKVGREGPYTVYRSRTGKYALYKIDLKATPVWRPPAADIMRGPLGIVLLAVGFGSVGDLLAGSAAQAGTTILTPLPMLGILTAALSYAASLVLYFTIGAVVAGIVTMARRSAEQKKQAGVLATRVESLREPLTHQAATEPAQYSPSKWALPFLRSHRIPSIDWQAAYARLLAAA